MLFITQFCIPKLFLRIPCEFLNDYPFVPYYLKVLPSAIFRPWSLRTFMVIKPDNFTPKIIEKKMSLPVRF